MIRTLVRIVVVIYAIIILPKHVRSFETNSLDSTIQAIKTPNQKVDFIIKYLEVPENQYMSDAKSYALRAYDISKEIHYVSGKIHAAILLGYYYFRDSDYKLAMEYAKEASELSEDLSLEKELGYSLRLIGTIYNEFGDYNNSSQYFFRSLKIFEEVGDKDGMSQALGDIGMDFYYQNEFQKATEYYRKALKLALETGNILAEKRQYNNIANVYGDLMQADTAIFYLEKAIQINRNLNDYLGEATNIMNIGFNRLNQGRYEAAILEFDNSMEIFKKIKNRTRICECSLNLAYTYEAMGNVNAGIKYFKDALSLAKDLRHHRVIYLASQALNKVYKETLNDTIKAYQYLAEEKAANDSLFVLQNQKQLNKLEMQYMFEKREMERKQKQQEKNALVLFVVFGLVSVIIILSLILSRLRLKSKFVVLEKEKISAELDIRKRELSVKIISLIRKNEMIAGVSDELIRLEKKAKSQEVKDVIAVISRKLRSGVNDKMMEEFSVQFQEVHAGFFDSLLKMFPDLTQNELKLCAFLRLNMTTKDISELTGQQMGSIDKARYRLRKKLGISNSDTILVSFLTKI